MLNPSSMRLAGRVGGGVWGAGPGLVQSVPMSMARGSEGRRHRPHAGLRLLQRTSHFERKEGKRRGERKLETLKSVIFLS